jgi:hypothetical protein
VGEDDVFRLFSCAYKERMGRSGDLSVFEVLGFSSRKPQALRLANGLALVG